MKNIYSREGGGFLLYIFNKISENLILKIKSNVCLSSVLQKLSYNIQKQGFFLYFLSSNFYKYGILKKKHCLSSI